MKIKGRQSSRAGEFSPAEQRAARSERIKVIEAKPFGWIAQSELGGERRYRLFRDPKAKQLACTCADFIYNKKTQPSFECKHISAVLKFIGRRYLAQEYGAALQSGDLF